MMFQIKVQRYNSKIAYFVTRKISFLAVDMGRPNRVAPETAPSSFFFQYPFHQDTGGFWIHFSFGHFHQFAHKEAH